MIAFIEGKLIEKNPGSAVLLQGGIGFLIEISMSTYYALPDLSTNVSFYISTQFRDDAIRFFGFTQKIEREIFEILLTVNRIGPKAALSILAGLEVDALVRSIVTEDVKSLSTIQGIGKKTAERIVFELKDKISQLNIDPKSLISETTDPEMKRLHEAISICENLGYKHSDVEIAAQRVASESPSIDLQQLIRKILKLLSGRGIQNA